MGKAKGSIEDSNKYKLDVRNDEEHMHPNYMCLCCVTRLNRDTSSTADTEVVAWTLFLYLKFYIHRCKFQNNSPSFQTYKNLIKIKITSEYKIAECKGKLSKHLKKFSFDLGF